MPAPEASPPPARRRPLVLRVVLIALAALIALIAAILILLVVFVHSAAFDRQVRTRVLPRLSDRIGRQITVGSVGASVFPPTVHLQDLQVHGRTSKPLLLAKRADARISIWSVLASRGKRVELRSLNLREFQINLVRLPGGAWDVPSQKRKSSVGRVRLDHGRFREGTVLLTDNGSLMAVTDVQGTVSLRSGILTFSDLRGQAYGGTLAADGTRVNLLRRSWTLAGSCDGLRLSDLPSHPFSGLLGGRVHVSASTQDPKAIRSTVSGRATLSLRQARWSRLDLEAEILRKLQSELKRYGLAKGVVENLPTGTEIGDLDAALAVTRGWMQLEQPVEVRTSYGSARLTGRFNLDRRVDMNADTDLPPAVFDQLTDGRFRPDEPVPVTVAIGGTLRKPEVTSIEFHDLAPLLLREGIKRLPVRIPGLSK